MVFSLTVSAGISISNPHTRLRSHALPLAACSGPSAAAGTQPVLASTSQPADVLPAAPSSVQVLGSSLYSHYALSLELAGILLTIALVGAVVIARKNTGSMHDALGSGKIPTE